MVDVVRQTLRLQGLRSGFSCRSDQKRQKPLTVDHKLGIVSINSYTAKLNPSRSVISVRE